MSRSHLPPLTIQVDVDTTRHLALFYGHDPGPPDQPDPVYTLALPRFAELLASLGLPATFFVTGRELSEPAHAQVVRQLISAGHEIANHTYSHSFAWSRLESGARRAEIERAHRAIAAVAAGPPVGFRAPGWDLDPTTLEILRELGYVYDSSVFPSAFTLLLRSLQLVARRGRTWSGYGSLRFCWAPTFPYRPAVGAPWRSSPRGGLWEIPVTVVPGCRLPFYSTAHWILPESVSSLCALTLRHRFCNYVFHAVDLLDRDELDPRLRRHPGAQLRALEKASRIRRLLERLRERRRPLTTRDLVCQLRASLSRRGAVDGVSLDADTT